MQPLLEIIDLSVTVPTNTGEASVVDGVSLAIPRGRVVALVGESGCGKSLTALSIPRLIPNPAKIAGGRMLWHGESPGKSVDLLRLNEEAMRRFRGGRVAMIVQEPMTALNPVFSVGEQIVEAIELHQSRRGKAAWAEAVTLLRRVGVVDAERRVRDYPHQFSGGMRQRAMIAMALACRPALLIADEPTTALDATIATQILELLRTLQVETGLSVLLITHDLGAVARIADEVYVMYAGRIVEHAPTERLFVHPLHPYTKGLLRCTPKLDERRERLETIAGNVPDPSRFPSGCRFHPRCSLSAERAKDASRETVAIHDHVDGRVLRRCVEKGEPGASGVPPLREAASNHRVACWEA